MAPEKKSRIKIEDLPEGRKISKKEMKLIFGGPNRRDSNNFLQPNFTTGSSGGSEDLFNLLKF